ncbi:MAG: DUF523 domain-containing protein [Eubacteriales bacterium]|nr:DUF523 domain-containing protein [Eubacteriales bacterium]
MDIASACLAGKKCRYDGESREDPKIKEMVERGEVKAVCPECMARLPIPRCPSEIVGGDGGDVLLGSAMVLGRDGSDRTKEFIDGARKTLAAAKKCGARRAYMKAKSPSCGCGAIYDGTFSRTLKKGDGVTSALLKKNGIDVTEV